MNHDFRRRGRALRSVFVAASCSCLLATVVSAQQPGDTVVSVYPDLLAVSPRGGVTTIHTAAPDTSFFGGLEMAPDNDAILMARLSSTRRRTELVSIRRGAVTTVLSLPAANGGMPFSVQSDGRIRFIRGFDVFEMPAGGGPALLLQSEAARYASWIVEEPATGDSLVIGRTSVSQGVITRVSGTGRVTSLTFPIPTTFTVSPDSVHLDADGTLLYTRAHSVLRVDPNTGVVLPWMALPLPPNGTDGALLDRDPRRGEFALGQGTTLFRFDASNRRLTTQATLPGSAGGVLAYGSGMLTERTPPIAGTRFQMNLSMPGEAGTAYIVTASFGFTPGFTVGNRTIPQNVDALYVLSLAAGGIFRNFQGTLDAAGRAVPAIDLLPGTTGLRIFIAAASYDASGLRVVSDPFGVTID